MVKKINNVYINVEINVYTILKTVPFLTMHFYTFDIEVSYLLQIIMSCFYSSITTPVLNVSSLLLSI